VLCGNLLDHIKDLEVEKAKVELRLEEELKEAKVEKAKVKLWLKEELELMEAVFFVNDNSASNGEVDLKDVKGVEEGDANVNATTVKENPNTPKSVKLAEQVKLAKSTDMWYLSPFTPLLQEARDKPRKVCPINLRGEVWDGIHQLS
jgi:shikimate 5-dehydrogenase